VGLPFAESNNAPPTLENKLPDALTGPPGPVGFVNCRKKPGPEKPPPDVGCADAPLPNNPNLPPRPAKPACNKASLGLSPANNEAMPDPAAAPKTGPKGVAAPMMGAAILNPFSNIPFNPLSIISLNAIYVIVNGKKATLELKSQLILYL
jgi:hypothetical protein